MVRAAEKHIRESPLLIDDCKNFTLSALCSRISRHVKERHSEIVFIDCLNLITTDKTLLSEKEQLSYICLVLKNLSVVLNVPIVIMAQVPNTVTYDEDNMEVSNLGIFEATKQDADELYYIVRKRECVGEYCNYKIIKLITLKTKNNKKRLSSICYAKEHTKSETLKQETPQISSSFTKKEYLDTIKTWKTGDDRT